MSGKTVLILGSFAPSLVNFRGSLIAAISARGHKVIAAAPSISDEIASRLRKLGAEPRQLPLVNASLNPLAMFRSLQDVRRLIRQTQPEVIVSYTTIGEIRYPDSSVATVGASGARNLPASS